MGQVGVEFLDFVLSLFPCFSSFLELWYPLVQIGLLLVLNIEVREARFIGIKLVLTIFGRFYGDMRA